MNNYYKILTNMTLLQLTSKNEAISKKITHFSKQPIIKFPPKINKLKFIKFIENKVFIIFLPFILLSKDIFDFGGFLIY
jgi:hypothetical protein